ncbi:hypothetical protein KCP71_15435 [Salmonella enterica subsp. enterica]|nr:hypothetical protein KCP71_15435 [Salmonella enterica subsp. enterica]
MDAASMHYPLTAIWRCWGAAGGQRDVKPVPPPRRRCASACSSAPARRTFTQFPEVG